MSHVTKVTIQRNSTTIAQHLVARIEEASPMLSADLGGASPYNLFNIMFLGSNPDVRRSDSIIDEQETNPQTNALSTYLVRGRPEKFSTGSQIQGIELLDEVISE